MHHCYITLASLHSTAPLCAVVSADEECRVPSLPCAPAFNQTAVPCPSAGRCSFCPSLGSFPPLLGHAERRPEPLSLPLYLSHLPRPIPFPFQPLRCDIDYHPTSQHLLPPTST